MGFKHCLGMIGTMDRDETKKAPCDATESQNEFLSNLAKKVNKHNNIDLPFNPEEKADNLGRVSGFAVGVGSLYLQEALGYPFIVLRRQCQLNSGCLRYHILPFTYFPVVNKIYRRQGLSVFWKGWGSTCIVKGVTIATEIAVSEIMHIPRRDNEKDSDKKINWKKILTQELLKGLSLLLTLPFYSASLVDTVQTNALDPPRSAFAFLLDAFHRLIGSYSSRGHGRLLPIYSLILPSIMYGVLRYTTKTFVAHVVLRLNEQRYSLDSEISEEHMRKIYYVELLSNVFASFITDVIVYPFETVVVRLHLQGTRTIIDDTDKGTGVVPLCTNYTGVLDCVEMIHRKEGIAGFFKGFGALLAQYAIQALIVKLAKPMYSLKA